MTTKTGNPGKIFALTPSDTAQNSCRGFYVNVAGDVVLEYDMALRRL